MVSGHLCPTCLEDIAETLYITLLPKASEPESRTSGGDGGMGGAASLHRSFAVLQGSQIEGNSR